MKKRAPSDFTKESIRQIAETIATDKRVLNGENFLGGASPEKCLTIRFTGQGFCWRYIFASELGR